MTEVPDLPSAQVAARLQGTRVEITDYRTETTTTFANPDGTLTREATLQPTRVRSGNSWVPVDTQLINDATGLHPKAIRGSLTLPTTAKGKARLASGSRALSLAWPGSLPAPVVTGDTATYPNVAAGVDLQLRASRTGFEFSLILKVRPTGTVPVFRLPLTRTGLTAAQDSAGVIRLSDSSGTSVMIIDPPVMWDAQTDAAGDRPHQGAVTMSLVARGASHDLVLAPSSTFLLDPATVYPVVVDPLVHIGEVNDTWVNSGVPNNSMAGSQEMRTGYHSTPTVGTERAFLKFDTAGIAGSNIISANLSLYQYYAMSCTAKNSRIYRLNQPFSDSTTWNTKPGADPTIYAQMTEAHGSTGCAPWWTQYNVTSLVANWASGALVNYGMLVRSGTETDTTAWWRFRGGDYTDTSKVPTLAVTYNFSPYQPANIWPPVNGYVSDPNASLSATLTDPDGLGGGKLYSLWYVTDTTAGGTVVINSGRSTPDVDDGETATHGLAGLLTDGHVYSLKARTCDSANCSAWTNTQTFTADFTNPNTPGVSSSDYPVGSWRGAGGAGSFTFTDSSGDVDFYLYGLDTTTPNTPTGTGQTASVSITPVDGWHTLYVRAVDKAGRLSPISQYAFGAGSAHVTSPVQGAVTSASVNLSASAPPGASQVNFYYRRANVDAWTLVPLGDVTGTTTWPFSFTAFTGNNQSTPLLSWGVKNTVQSVDGPVQVGACFGSSTACPPNPGTSLPVGSSSAAGFQLDQNTMNVAATQDIGVGTVNLVTGNAAVSTTDVSVPGSQGTSLSVGRTLNARLANTTSGIFGAGWTPSLPIDTAGSDWTGLSDYGSILNVTGPDQSLVSFAKTGTNTYVAAGEDADSGLTVMGAASGCDATYGCFQLTDLDGNKSIFQSAAANPGVGTPTAAVAYQVHAVLQAGSTTATTFSYTSGRVTDILSPQPAVGTCTDPASSSTWSPGCKSLHLSYTGDNHLDKVTYRTSDGTNPLQIDVACYTYTGSGSTAQLTKQWDPRDIAAQGSGSYPIQCDQNNPVRPTVYGYDSVQRLSTITPAGLAATTLTYDSSASTGRLTQVESTSGASTLSSTVLYEVPVAGSGTDRPSLTSSDTDTWAQTDNPDSTVDGVAICPPGASVTTASGDLRDCTISYVDTDGHLVNTASYAAGWHISTTEYDSGGRVVRTLSAANREEALNPTVGAGLALGLPTDTKMAALDLSTLNIYTLSALDGQPDLTDSFGPYHWVRLANGTEVKARAHTQTTYDDGTEPGHPTDVYNQPIALHLVRTVTTGASLSPDAVATDETDKRVSEIRYWLGTDYTGWTYRQPMQTITDPTGLAITNTTLYDAASGRVTQSRMPSNTAGGGVGTTLTTYYTEGTTDIANCVNTLWVGLACKTLPAADARVAGSTPSLVTTTTTAYDYLNRPTSVQDSVTDAAGTVRTRTSSSTFGFNSSGNPYANTLYSTALTGGAGNDAAVPTRTFSYDTTTGLPTGVSAAATTENPATATASSYDGFGRVTSYTEDTAATGGQANMTTTSYEVNSGRVATTTDAHTTTTYTYNGGLEHRGLPTSVSVAVAGSTPYTGTFTASYDADGQLATQTDPNGIISALTRNETGQLTTLTDTVVATSGSWLTDSTKPSIHGQWLHHSNNVATQDYTYDAHGRLTQAADKPVGMACQTRTYDFTSGSMGVNSNRLASTTYPDAGDGNCQTGTLTGGTTTSHTYDGADRLTDTGVTYDGFGRITALPAAAAGGSSLTDAFYANDLVRSQTQGGATQCWTLDANQHLKRTATYTGTSCTGTATLDYTNHYNDASSDAPDWIAETADGSTWKANITGPLGNLAVVVDQTGTAAYQYTNLHGDILATAPNSTTPYFNPHYDEFGNRTSGNSARYGWLGGKQRSADALGGVILMGVRLYTPVLGRFLQTDPIVGGSANAYDYSYQDPVNVYDLDGRCPICAVEGGAAIVWVGGAALAAAGLIQSRPKFYVPHLGNPFGSSSHAHQTRARIGGRGTQWVSNNTMYAKKKRLPTQNSGRSGHTSNARGSSKERHQGAQNHGGARRIPPNPNKRNRQFGSD